jgi:hypothetical protein
MRGIPVTMVTRKQITVAIPRLLRRYEKLPGKVNLIPAMAVALYRSSIHL